MRLWVNLSVLLRHHKIKEKTIPRAKKYSRAKKLSKTRFLRELQQGFSIKEICRQWGYKSTGTIYTWRRKDAEFDAAVQKCLASPVHRERLDSVTRPKNSEGNWQDRFFTKLRETKDRVLACDSAEISVMKMLSLLNPKSDEYDLQFKLKYEEEVARDSLQIEDEVKKKALIDNSLQTQMYLLPNLPIVGERYERGHRNRLRQVEAQNNVLVITGDGIDGAKRLLQDLFGTKEVRDVEEFSVSSENTIGLPSVGTGDGGDDGIRSLTP